jgi:hypothetical protein
MAKYPRGAAAAAGEAVMLLNESMVRKLVALSVSHCPYVTDDKFINHHVLISAERTVRCVQSID